MSEPLQESVIVRVGSIRDLSAHAACVVPLPPLAWDLHREALVVLDERGAPRAYLNRCKHLPIPLDGGTRKFFDSTGRYLFCGTHGALYERGSGYCISGPCRGRLLDPIALRVDAAGVVTLVLSP